MSKKPTRGLAPRSLVADADRRSALESLDRPRKSPAAAFVRAALESTPTATATIEAPKAPTPAPAADRTLIRVPLASIDLTRRRFQYRLSRNLARLQESLLLQGQQVPVILRGTAPYEIVSGFGRCEALALAHAQGKLADASVWADVRPRLTDREAHEISVIENEDREDLSELDRVNKAKKLKEEGYAIADIAFVLKKGERMIQYYLSLADAPSRIADALSQGKLRPTHALVLTKFARESLGELTPAEIETKLDTLIERCSRGASVAALRSELGPEASSQPRLFVARDGGFELRGFHYASSLPLEMRQAMCAAVEQALKAIRSDLRSS
jgi:ParB/RepB/Spo0J family partition protein